MYTFQYKHGDRPLEGYTIERAAGRGGFGEVYYAVSDSGRQVALKAVQGYEQIELRGIGQCMNLKNPHLVTIFDVRHNDAGRPFVIMEFVAGPSLRQVLDEAPAGLGEQKAAFFLREIAKGLSYLHENGIVHRDLKPANIFYENGYVKIGDYGLSKLIDAGANSGQTVTVGTVHYMAPEVGAGRYDRSIDIYALGAVLYEMLTGTVPFTGGSPSEVLIKHLSRDPDTANIPEPFATVIRRAMAKDPAQRYTNVQEMVEAVFGSQHVQQSMSCFSPDELSVVAAHAAARAAIGTTGRSSGAAPVGTATASDMFDRAGQWADRLTDRVATAGGRWFDGGPGNAAPSSHTMAVDPPPDPLNQRQRRNTAFIAGIGIALLGAAIHSNGHNTFPLDFFFAGSAIMGGVLGLRASTRRISYPLVREPRLVPRIAVGGPAAIMVALCSFPFCIALSGMHNKNMAAVWLGVAAPLLFMDAARWADPNRRQRVCFWGNAFLAGLFAFIVANIFDGPGEMAAIVAGGICFITELRSPWNPQPKAITAPPLPQMPIPPPVPWPGSASPIPPFPQPGSNGAPIPAPFAAPPTLPPLPQIPGFVRMLWLMLTCLSFSVGLTLLISTGVQRNPDIPSLVAAGVALLLTALICFIQFFRHGFAGWWSYLGRSLLLIQSIAWIAGCSAALGGESLNDRQQAIFIFLIVLASLLAIAALAIPGRRRRRPTVTPAGFAQAIADHAATSWQTKWQQKQWRAQNKPHHTALSAFAGVVASYLLFAATLLTLAVALNVPEAMSLGLPNAAMIQKLTAGLFADYPAWPELLTRLADVAIAICAAIGLGAMVLHRGSGGVWYVLRGIVAVLGIFVAASMLGHAFHRYAWTTIAYLVNQHHSAAAIIAAVLDGFDSRGAIGAGAVWLISMLLLSWRPRRMASTIASIASSSIPSPAPIPSSNATGVT